MAFYRASIGGGGGGSVTGYSLVKGVTSINSDWKTSQTISNMNGKKLLVLCFGYSSNSNLAYNRYDSISVSGGTLTKITNLLPEAARAAGTYYKLDVTSDNCVLSASFGFYVDVFEGN